MNPDDGHLETDGCDGAVTAAIPMDADVFWSHCWTDECQLEEEEHSSVYVKALTNALNKAQNRYKHYLTLHHHHGSFLISFL